jgi:dTDP-4-dehydrorhamnose 3,5-epimerase
VSETKVKSLKIKDCWVFTPRVFHDSRGSFHEWFQTSTFIEQVGSNFHLAQANCSVSGKGVIRGIHFAKQPPGQAKYVTCLSGKIFDVLVDLRKGSTTFGRWVSVEIDSKTPSVLYVPSGIGHSFMAMEDNTTVIYLCDQSYNPQNEFDISPFDKKLNIKWPQNITPVLSEKDANGNSFESLMDVYPEY